MTPLFGHNPAVTAFRDAHASGRLHHAWLISGPAGIGKALFALNAARRMLAEAAGPRPRAEGLQVEDDHRIAKLMDAESHPDFKLIEREAWDSKGNIIPKHERSANETPGRNIRVKQIRMLAPLLSNTPFMSFRRVIIIDAADDLEDSAANALLKSLEEPAAGTVFFLVSHSPERLLPTIRSRCRHLRLKPLDDAAMRSALNAAIEDAEPGEIDGLVAVGEGSPGRALAFRGLDIAKLDRAMRALASEGDPTNARRVKLAAELSPKSAQARYEAFLARAPSFIATEARARRGPALAQALGMWERARDLAGNATRLSLDPHSVVFELGGMLASLSAKRV